MKNKLTVAHLYVYCVLKLHFSFNALKINTKYLLRTARGNE